MYHTTDDKLVNEIRDLNTWKVVQDLLHLTPSIINEFPEFYLTYGQIYGISPDGKYLASLTSVSCAKGEPCIIYELSIVSLTTGETLTSNKFTGSVFGPLKNTVQFSPNGKFLAANGQEPNLFRVTDGGNLELIKSYSTYSSNIIFSKDSQFLVLENMLVNSTNGETVLDFKNPYFGRYTISPDSNTLAGLQENTNLINLWSTSGELVKVIESNHTASIQSLEFNSDGTQLLSSSADGTVKLWDVSTASLLNTFTGYSSYVEKMVLSPDEKMLAINSSFQEGSSKAIVQLWNLESKELVQELKSTGLLLSDMVFSPDSSMLATGNTEGINIWQVSSGQLLQTYSKPFIFSTKLGFSKDNSVLGIYTSHISSEEPNFNPESLFKLAFMEVSSGQILDEFNYQNVIFDPNSNFYAARELASIDTLQIFDMNTRERIQSISSLSGKTEFSNTGEQLVSIRGQTIDIRNIATGEIVSSKTIDSTHNFSLSNTASFFSPDISQIASQHKTNQTQIKLWSTQTGQLLHELTGHHSESPIIFTTDGTKLIVGSGHSDHNNTITIYSTPNSNPVFTNQSTN